MGLGRTLAGFMMASLFAFLIIMFAIDFGHDNDSVTNIDQDSGFHNLTRTTVEDMNLLYVESNLSATAVQEGTISTQTEATEGGTEYKVGAWTAFSSVKNVITLSFSAIFGKNPISGIIFTALVSFFVFIIGWYIMKAWKGNPD